MASPFANFADATTAEGRKLWELATKPLKSLFDGTKSGYPLFKSQLRNRIRECHWGDIVNFQINGQTQNLVDNADLIPMASVTLQRRAREVMVLNGVQVAINQAMVNLQVKRHFQSQMLHKVLVESVSGDLEKHVAELQNNDKTFNDGPTLLKLIQDKARGKAIRQQMKNAREAIKSLSLKEHKWNITSFNEKLEGLLTTLKNNEEQFLAKDILDVVVNNYKLVKHQDFSQMVSMETLAAEKADRDIDYEELMALGDEKFQSLVNQGIWGKRTAQEDQILALQTQLKALQSQQDQASKKGTPSTPGTPTQPTGNGKSRYGKKSNYAEWQFKNPDKKKTVKKTIKVKGVKTDVTYHWCPHHNQNKGMWVRHKPEDCKNKDKPPPTPTTTLACTRRLAANPLTLDEPQRE